MTFTADNGAVYVATHTNRPFCVRTNGNCRYFGSVQTARRHLAMVGGALFFDYKPGCGHFIERI